MVEKRQTEKTGLRDDLSRAQKRLKQLEDEVTVSSSQTSPRSGLGESSSNEGEKPPSSRRRAGTITGRNDRLQRPEPGPRSYSDQPELPGRMSRRDGRTSPLPDSELSLHSVKESLSRIESATSSRSELSGRSGSGMVYLDEESPSKMKTPIAARERTRSTDEDEDTPTGKRLQVGLLPAPPIQYTPMSEKRMKGDSSISFEPEVREYLALAQTPPPAGRDGFPSIPGSSRVNSGLSPMPSTVPSRLSTPPPPGDGLPSLIPVSPCSDQPDNRSLGEASGFKTPDSGRPGDASRMEKQDALSTKSAPEVRPVFNSQVDGPPTPISMQGESRTGSRSTANESSNTSNKPSSNSVRRQGSVHKPEGTKKTHIPRLVPRLLPYTRCSIPSSRIVPNTLGKEALSFIVSIQLRPPGDLQVYNWNVAKFFSSFVELDTRLRQKMSKKELKQAKLSSLPEGRAWKDYGPAKMDRMKVGSSRDFSPMRSTLTYSARRLSRHMSRISWLVLWKTRPRSVLSCKRTSSVNRRRNVVQGCQNRVTLRNEGKTLEGEYREMTFSPCRVD